MTPYGRAHRAVANQIPILKIPIGHWGLGLNWELGFGH